MAKLVYTSIMSLDGYIEDEHGRFEWAVPDDEVHAFINDLERCSARTFNARRMYETMAGWETDLTLGRQSPLMADFAQSWQAAGKVVYSTMLATVSTTRTRLERTFDFGGGPPDEGVGDQ